MTPRFILVPLKIIYFPLYFPVIVLCGTSVFHGFIIFTVHSFDMNTLQMKIIYPDSLNLYDSTPAPLYKSLHFGWLANDWMLIAEINWHQISKTLVVISKKMVGCLSKNCHNRYGTQAGSY